MKAGQIKIYVVTHKNFNVICTKPYQVIAVGDKSKIEIKDNFLRDDEGENIEWKNPNFCELTALYWIWKNDNNSDIIGLCHYRRYLSKSMLSDSTKYILTEEDIRKCFKKGYDIILPYKPIARRNVAEIYCDFGYEKDIRLLGEIIERKCPEYLDEYNCLWKRHSNYPANILVLSREKFTEYTTWLFDLLFELEQINDISEYTEQEARIYGFLSERLLDVWVRKNKLKVKHYRMINTEEKRTIMKLFLDIGSVLTTWMKNY